MAPKPNCFSISASATLMASPFVGAAFEELREGEPADVGFSAKEVFEDFFVIVVEEGGRSEKSVRVNERTPYYQGKFVLQALEVAEKKKVYGSIPLKNLLHLRQILFPWIINVLLGENGVMLKAELPHLENDKSQKDQSPKEPEDRSEEHT